MLAPDVDSEPEIDLHALTWHEALPVFIDFYNESIRQAAGGPVGKLDVIHGYGSSGAGGVLRKRLRNFLQEHADQGLLEFTPGEHTDANPGHTLVLPIKSLPNTYDMLGERILDYCARPRTLSKISGKFRRHGEPAVKAAIDSLVRQGRLRTTGKGSRKVYEAR